MKNIILLLLFVAGMVLSFGYFIYAVTSGETVAQETVFRQDVVRTPTDTGKVFYAASETQRNSPMLVSLSTDMNPIRINAICSHSSGRPAGAEAHFRAQLNHKDQTSWTKGFVVSHDRSDIGSHTNTSTIRVKDFQITETGDYSLDVTAVPADGQLLISKLDIDVRRNVLIVDSRIVIAGVALLVVWLVSYGLTSKHNNTWPSPPNGQM